MVEHRCRYCHQPVRIPQYFLPTQQRVFEHIWDNPYCSAKEIMFAIYGRDLLTNVVAVHISKIKKGLEDTPYRLAWRRKSEKPRMGRKWTAHIYRIEPKVAVVEERPNEGMQDGTV